MMVGFLKAALTHYKTSVAGIAAAALIVVQAYKTGMTWKQWAMAAAVAFLGISAGDALPAAPAAPKP